MPTLVQVLTGYAAQMPGSPAFLYSRKSEQNANDDIDYSNGLINLLEIDQPGFAYNSTNGNLRRRYPCFIQFVKKLEPDTTAADRDSTIEEMMLLVAAFIIKIDKGDLFDKLQPVIPGQAIVNYYDSNVVGAEINLILIPNEPMAICV